MTPENGSPGSPPPPPDWRQLRDQRRLENIQRRVQWAQQRKEWRRQHPGPGPIIPGLILLIIGSAFLLSNLGFFDIRIIRDYWPSLLIVLGVGHLLFPRAGARSLLLSGALILVGGLLQAQILGYVHGNVWAIVWPVWLIFMGLSFLFRGRARFSGCAGAPPWGGSNPDPLNHNRLNESSVFGGVKQRFDSQEFEGGYLSSVFSGMEIDLRGANTKLDELFIQADAVFGGIELMLPAHWSITVRGTGIFGGFEDQTHPPASPAEKRPHLTITGSAVFGGVSVKN